MLAWISTRQPGTTPCARSSTCSCSSFAHGVLDKDGDSNSVCAGASSWFRVGAPRHDWLLKVCQADQTLKRRHTTYTPVLSATHVALVQRAPSSLVQTLATTAFSVDPGPSAYAGTAVQPPAQPPHGIRCALAGAQYARRIYLTI
jgi:hypothetical protein